MSNTLGQGLGVQKEGGMPAAVGGGGAPYPNEYSLHSEFVGDCGGSSAVGADDYAGWDNGYGAVADNPFSVSFWLKIVDFTLGSQGIGLGYQFGLAAGVILWEVGWLKNATTNVLFFTLKDGSTGGQIRVTALNITGNLDDSQWHHWTWTYDGSALNSGLNCYLDGVLYPYGTVNQNFGTYNKMQNPSGLGYRAHFLNQLTISGSGINLLIDDLAIWDVELTQVQAAQDMNINNKANHPAYGNLTNWYKFENVLPFTDEINGVTLLGTTSAGLDDFSTDTPY